MLNLPAKGSRFENSNPAIFSYLLFAISIGLLLAAMTIGIWAEQHPLVARTSTGMNFPKPLFFASLVTSIGWVAFLARFFRGRLIITPKGSETPIPQVGNIFVISFLAGCPAFLFFYGLCCALNQLADHNEPRAFRTTVLDKGTTVGNKTGRSWHLWVKDWRDSSDIVRLSAREYEYDAATGGTPVRVVTKPGALGYEWIISRSIATQSGS